MFKLYQACAACVENYQSPMAPLIAYSRLTWVSTCSVHPHHPLKPWLWPWLRVLGSSLCWGIAYGARWVCGSTHLSPSGIMQVEWAFNCSEGSSRAAIFPLACGGVERLQVNADSPVAEPLICCLQNKQEIKVGTSLSWVSREQLFCLWAWCDVLWCLWPKNHLQVVAHSLGGLLGRNLSPLRKLKSAKQSQGRTRCFLLGRVRDGRN